jgi:hypothetical protein
LKFLLSKIIKIGNNANPKLMMPLVAMQLTVSLTVALIIMISIIRASIVRENHEFCQLETHGSIPKQTIWMLTGLITIKRLLSSLNPRKPK